MDDSCCSMNVVNNLIGILLLMISRIIGNEVTDESIFGIEREIKIFLSKFDLFREVILHLKQIISVTDSKYNYLSLLNIPRPMKLFGTMANLWEGSNQGEGNLRLAKPKLTNIHS